jgi:HJR/Mrr/RecB family endonuclease
MFYDKSIGRPRVDLIAKRDGTVVAIQAKCYSGIVGNHAIMDAVAGARFYNANQCMVITNSTFTKIAIELARANNVILWDRKTLIEKI